MRRSSSSIDGSHEMDDLLHIQADEIETLRERIRQLVDALAPSEFSPPLEWGLTATESRLYAHLRSRPLSTKDALAMAAYGHWIGETPDPQVIESHISKMRRKLRRHGQDVKSERFKGYWLVDFTAKRQVQYG